MSQSILFGHGGCNAGCDCESDGSADLRLGQQIYGCGITSEELIDLLTRVATLKTPPASDCESSSNVEAM